MNNSTVKAVCIIILVISFGVLAAAITRAVQMPDKFRGKKFTVLDVVKENKWFYFVIFLSCFVGRAAIEILLMIS